MAHCGAFFSPVVESCVVTLFVRGAMILFHRLMETGATVMAVVMSRRQGPIKHVVLTLALFLNMV